VREGHGGARNVAEPLTSKETRAWPLAWSAIGEPGSLSLSAAGCPAPATTKPSRQRCATSDALFGIACAASPPYPTAVAKVFVPETKSNSERHLHRSRTVIDPISQTVS
jgi:hypothetical protein